MVGAGALCLLLCLDKVFHAWATPSSLVAQETPGWRTSVDCVRASELCGSEASCSSRYRTLRQCVAGRDRNTMLANKECQAALEVLQESPLYHCHCKRGMKKEQLCLQIYWSIHLGLTGGEEFYEASPYEPVTSRLSDIFRLASIVSGTDPAAVSSKSNHCLDAAKACNLNNNCKRLRSDYISICNREVSVTERCNRRRCHRALRQFFDRVPSEYTYRLLFCSCKDQACAERRRQTIVPDCSYEDKEKANCLELRSQCRSDPLCRSRLADFHTNCVASSFQSPTDCPGDNYQACLGSYTGLMGFDVMPNYVDSSATNLTVSPSCSCRGSGNLEEECQRFLRDFTGNPCLRNAIQAFGNGTTKIPRLPPITLPPTMEKSPPSTNDVSTGNTLFIPMITTCASVQEDGPKLNQSKDLCIPKSLVPTDLPPQKTLPLDGSGCRHSMAGTLSALPFLLVKVAL